eukprot:1448147-Prymnesium_polylepis.1
MHNRCLIMLRTCAFVRRVRHCAIPSLVSCARASRVFIHHSSITARILIITASVLVRDQMKGSRAKRTPSTRTQSSHALLA